MRPRSLLLPLSFLALGMAPRPVTLFLAGDSTMAQKLATKRPETGWGEALQQYFDVDDVRVENHARNGRSTRSFLAEGRWQAMVDRLQPGDWVFVQFAHNDESREKGDRYTPPPEFKANLARFVDDVRGKGGNVVLLTPVVRRRFDEAGKLANTHGEYPELVREVAREKQVPLLDLEERTAALLTRLGAEGSRRLFLQLKAGEHPNYPQGAEDNTHFSPLGAELVAREAAEGLKELDIGLSPLLKLPALPPASGAAASVHATTPRHDGATVGAR